MRFYRRRDPCADTDKVLSVRIFEEFDDENLKGFTVWLPIMGGDSAETARVETEAFGDQRMALGWDPENRAGKLFTKTLSLRRTVWDAYLLYPPLIYPPTRRECPMTWGWPEAPRSSWIFT